MVFFIVQIFSFSKGAPVVRWTSRWKKPKVHVEVQHVGWRVGFGGRENAVSWTCCFWSGKKKHDQMWYLKHLGGHFWIAFPNWDPFILHFFSLKSSKFTTRKTPREPTKLKTAVFRRRFCSRDLYSLRSIPTIWQLDSVRETQDTGINGSWGIKKGGSVMNGRIVGISLKNMWICLIKELWFWNGNDPI